MRGGERSGFDERETGVGERSSLGAVRMHAMFNGWPTWLQHIGHLFQPFNGCTVILLSLSHEN